MQIRVFAISVAASKKCVYRYGYLQYPQPHFQKSEFFFLDIRIFLLTASARLLRLLIAIRVLGNDHILVFEPSLGLY
jgi:hypothetical protein